MFTVKEVVEQNLSNHSTADIYEIRNIKPTGIFYYNNEDVIKNHGSHFVESTEMICGIRGHEAVLRIYIKKSRSV